MAIIEGFHYTARNPKPMRAAGSGMIAQGAWKMIFIAMIHNYCVAMTAHAQHQTVCYIVGTGAGSIPKF